VKGYKTADTTIICTDQSVTTKHTHTRIYSNTFKYTKPSNDFTLFIFLTSCTSTNCYGSIDRSIIPSCLLYRCKSLSTSIRLGPAQPAPTFHYSETEYERLC